MVVKSIYRHEPELLIKFSELMKKKLFIPNVQSAQIKKQLTKFVHYKEVDYALHENFIRFGTKKATSFIIIDIDHVRCTLKEFQNRVKSVLGNISPNWILKTDKGFHVGIILERPVFFSNSEELYLLREIKMALTNALHGDIAGSFRTRGFWRNPLTHESTLNLKTYNIYDLHNRVSKLNSHSFVPFSKKQKKEKPVSIASTNSKNMNKETNTSKKGFVKGNRNNYLFSQVVNKLYSGEIKNDDVFKTLKEINSGALENNEIERIGKSILKYQITPLKKHRNSSGFIPGEYHEELNIQSIHNYMKNKKVSFERQRFGQKITTIKKVKSTIEQLVESYKKTYQKHQEFTNKNIIVNSSLNKRTLQRYRNQRRLEKDIKNRAFYLYIKELMGSKSSVIAKVTPLKDLVNKAIKEIEFEYKKESKIFSFKIVEDGRLIFYEKS